MVATFPPSSPTVLTQVLPSYLYQEYSDDDDLQAFVSAYNGMAQGYIDWFANTPLPVYTNGQIYGPLLDWVAEGLYGIVRPSIPSGLVVTEGPINTYSADELTPNSISVLNPANDPLANDDVFKRVITWNFYKGDGRVFNIRWLKRRIMRFLNGYNGTDVGTDETYNVSVTFGTGNQVNINILAGARQITKAALPNTFVPNSLTPNEMDTTYTPTQYPQLALTFKNALNAGVLSLPFQFTYVVSIV